MDVYEPPGQVGDVLVNTTSPLNECSLNIRPYLILSTTEFLKAEPRVGGGGADGVTGALPQGPV